MLRSKYCSTPSILLTCCAQPYQLLSAAGSNGSQAVSACNSVMKARVARPWLTRRRAGLLFLGILLPLECASQSGGRRAVAQRGTPPESAPSAVASYVNWHPDSASLGCLPGMRVHVACGHCAFPSVFLLLPAFLGSRIKKQHISWTQALTCHGCSQLDRCST